MLLEMSGYLKDQVTRYLWFSSYYFCEISATDMSDLYISALI